MQTIENSRGYLKFSDERVPLEDLQQFAELLAQDPRFVSVYIRKVSSNQHGIGFVSNVETHIKEDADRFFDDLKDTAMRKFGIGLVGWDISNRYYLVK